MIAAALAVSMSALACPPDHEGAPCLDFWNIAPHAPGEPLICFNADWNGDGRLDPDDLSDYITDFFTQMGLPEPMGCADVDCNGLDFDDLAQFVALFFTCQD